MEKSQLLIRGSCSPIGQFQILVCSQQPLCHKAGQVDDWIHLQADLQDIEKATLLAFKYALDAPELLKGEDSRSAFVNFTEVVAAAHPIDR